MSSQPRTVFFTHNWGENNANHNHCRDIAQFLKNEGIPMWFDEDRMEGQIKNAMVKGINESDVFLIAVTPTCMAKINKGDLTDNCLREFNYAMDQTRFADKFVCIVTDEDALDIRLWTDTFKMTVHNPLAINMCPSLKGEEREKNLRELATLLKRKLGQNGEPKGADIEAAQGTFAKMQMRSGVVWGADTSLTIESLSILLDLAKVPKPREIASLLIAHSNDSLKKLSALVENDLRALQITDSNSKLIFDGIIAKLSQVQSFETELKAASEAKTIMFWALMARNAQEAAAGCAAINRFLVKNEDDSPTLFKLGCNEAIMAAMRRYAADARVTEEACVAIGFISKEFYFERINLGEMAACEAVVAALKYFGAENARVAALGCDTIANLAHNDADNTLKLGQIGACEAVVVALQRFGAENAEVAEYGCLAIGILATDGFYNCEKLGQVGACEVAVAALKCFGTENAKVAESACGAIGNLARNDANNRKQLGHIGACEAVVTALQRFGAEDKKLAEQGCHAIYRLVVNNAGFKYLEDYNNENKLRELGAKAVVSNCLFNGWNAPALAVLE